MTTTESGAFKAILAHHAQLEDGVARRVGAVSTGIEADDRYAPAAADLVAYVADEVLPHAMAEEQTIYRAGADDEGLAETVAAMVGEHRQLAASVERLATAREPRTAATEAEAIGVLFAAHVAKENELLLPPLAADETVDLTGLLAQMHRLTQAAREETATVHDVRAPDTESSLLALLLDAAERLASAGEGDTACRLTAAAWAELRVPRPDLAVRTTAALHRLVRSVVAEPVAFSPARPVRAADLGRHLDVRALAPALRHEQIFFTYGALEPGSAFVLVNDHDPKPLRYQFEAEHPGEFTWDVIEDGPTVWQVRIGRPAAGGLSARGLIGEESELDVRVLPHGQRHHVIFAAYEALLPGHGFVLVNDHDPKPLRYQFEAEHPDRFTWDYLEAGPRTWRVRIGRSEVDTSQ